MRQSRTIVLKCSFLPLAVIKTTSCDQTTLREGTVGTTVLHFVHAFESIECFGRLFHGLDGVVQA